MKMLVAGPHGPATDISGVHARATAVPSPPGATDTVAGHTH
ncbi:hypothetical protein [Conexibacter sp. DBS9H8]|nr:hypothetical protein [Conexibacter sp. DBS9H8]